MNGTLFLNRPNRTVLLVFLVAAFFVLSSRSVAGGEATGGESVLASVTLGELIEYALKENPALRVSNVGIEAAGHKIRQATTLPDPVLTYSHGIDKIETRLGPVNSSVTLMQKIPFPGKLSVKGSAARVGVEIARSERSGAERALVARVKRLYYELYYIDRATALARENKAVLDYFVEVSRSNYSLNVSKLDRARLNEKSAKYDYLPDFHLGVKYTDIGESPMAVTDSGRDALGVSIGVTLPIWRGGKKAGVARARAEREQARLAVVMAATKVESEVRRLYQKVQSATEVARLYGTTLVPRAEESYEFAEAWYKNGQEKLGRLLETQSMWIDFRRVYFSAVRDFFIAVSELERITGEELL